MFLSCNEWILWRIRNVFRRVPQMKCSGEHCAELPAAVKERIKDMVQAKAAGKHVDASEMHRKKTGAQMLIYAS